MNTFPKFVQHMKASFHSLTVFLLLLDLLIMRNQMCMLYIISRHVSFIVGAYNMGGSPAFAVKRIKDMVYNNDPLRDEYLG